MYKQFISYKFIDSSGNMRDKIVRKVRSSEELNSTLVDGNSFGFCEASKSDVVLKPDKNSRHYDPIRQMDSVFCFLYDPAGHPIKECFRNRASDAMCVDEQTVGALFGVAPKFFICKKDGINPPIPIETNSSFMLAEVKKQHVWYGSLPPIDAFHGLRMEIAQNLEMAGLIIEGIHHDIAPGQCEISWKHSNLLKMCDQMMLFKYIAINVCAKYGLVAIFDAKPFANLNGNGCNVHQSIPAMTKFIGPDQTFIPYHEANMQIIEAYSQGLIDHYDSILNACCCICDRTKTVRIPMSGVRLELRIPNSDINPYVALPMMLKLGYEGVKRLETI